MSLSQEDRTFAASNQVKQGKILLLIQTIDDRLEA